MPTDNRTMQQDRNQYKAKNSVGQAGMIPAADLQTRKEVQLHAMPWHHGKISRDQAEGLLLYREDGHFLIRDSVHFLGDYTLSVVFEGNVDHYHILTNNNQLEVDGGDCFFDNLYELVEHYKKDADGLCTRLTRPLQKKGSNFSAVSIQDFKSSGWVINLKDLIIGEKIGKGEFGAVFHGTHKGTSVAVKQLQDTNNAAQSFLKEASVMTSLRHNNLVKLIGVVIGEEIFLVTEFMSKGNLVDYLRSRGRSVITQKDQINFVTDTCAGMQYLESKNFVHRDLAARNVLISQSGAAKVSDFGLAKCGDFSIESGKFPIKWTSPEALRDNKFTNKSDVWSFGILLWEVYSFGRVPYPRIPLTEVIMHVERGYRMEAPEGCPPEIYSIMMLTWNLESKKRSTFLEILEKLNNLRSVTL